ncbi:MULTISPECIES: universal stress protein UspE [Aeromonas]|uniref:universal stress protein UspE n=1 Tax=Aeromonas TaxID=642 RepID=UPI001C21C7DA|nr:MULTISPECIES: universal stress protein UspE [Aeromonas]QXC33071.1 universal stress protein UspE [Aeromonas sp. FDAARGOS 1407]UAK70560.1 universal stress protein UspE [Aeromonas enteropelogenes]
MVKYQNILVVINPEEERQIALERAVKIAELDNNAHLTLLLTIYDFSYEMTAMLSAEEREEMRHGVISQRQEWLDEILTPYREKGITCEVKVVWHNRPFECVIQEVLEQRHDLVVKATHHHSFLQTFIFTPTDWHLLRKCPCPVLLVKEGHWQRGGNIIAAINCSSDDPDQKVLNERITQEGTDIAELLGANLYLVNTYPGTPVNVAIELPEFDPKAYNEAIRKHHENLLLSHASKFGISDLWTRVAEGLPEEVLPDMAEELNANLMIMGCVGRTGLSAALLGNTAEHVVDRLPCDILILKPADYSCPVDSRRNQA